MSYKKGKPAPGTSRGLTSSEADATGLNRKVKHRVKVDRLGQVLVVVNNGASVIYGPTTRVVQELEAYWAKIKPKRVRFSPEINPTLLHPARRVLGTRPGLFPRNIIFKLECGHEHARQRRPRVPLTMRCTKCPVEKKAS